MWAIFYESGKRSSFFDKWTGIGPMFGATEKGAMKFKTKLEAIQQINAMPATAAVMCTVVEVEKTD